ncbi:MAG: UDP-N-acetylmuramate dehydrogenase, partial [Candidatus Sericytochromatia bacterium]
QKPSRKPRLSMHPSAASVLPSVRLSEGFEPDKPLAPFTSWRIGGAADFYVAPANEDEIRAIISTAHQHGIPLTVLGGGSNVLLSDQGLRGIVMHISHRFAGFEFLADGRVCAKAGTRLGTLIKKAMSLGLSGIEQLWGIPGTVGGAVVMNAGACNTETFDVLESVTSLTPNGETIVRTKEQIRHGYRWSDYKYNGEIVIEATLQLAAADPVFIQSRFDAADERRKPQHNIRLPNSGSIFRNPAGNFAGRLIEQMGAKGRIHGQVQVSPDHANFIVNLGHARARDACLLIQSLQADVLQRYSVQLEPEVIFLGEF